MLSRFRNLCFQKAAPSTYSTGYLTQDQARKCALKAGIPEDIALQSDLHAKVLTSIGSQTLTIHFGQGFRKICAYDNGKLLVTDGIPAENLKYTRVFNAFTGSIFNEIEPLTPNEMSDTHIETKSSIDHIRPSDSLEAWVTARTLITNAVTQARMQ